MVHMVEKVAKQNCFLKINNNKGEENELAREYDFRSVEFGFMQAGRDAESGERGDFPLTTKHYS